MDFLYFKCCTVTSRRTVELAKQYKKSCISFYEPVHLQEKNYTKNVKLKSIGSRVNCGHNKLANYADVLFIKLTSTYILKISQKFSQSYCSKLAIFLVSTAYLPFAIFFPCNTGQANNKDLSLRKVLIYDRTTVRHKETMQMVSAEAIKSGQKVLTDLSSIPHGKSKNSWCSRNGLQILSNVSPRGRCVAAVAMPLKIFKQFLGKL